MRKLVRTILWSPINMRVTVFLVALFVSAFGTGLSAQTPVVPTPIKKEVRGTAMEKVTVTLGATTSKTLLDLAEHPVNALTRVYLTGDGDRLTKLAIEILDTLSCDDDFFVLPKGSPCIKEGKNTSQYKFDWANDYVALSWVGGDYSGKRTIYRIIVHQGYKDPYSVTLPGIVAPSLPSDAQPATKPSAVLYEVFLSSFESADHDSLYTFTATTNPFEAQIPAFVEKATGPLFAAAAKSAGTIKFDRMSVDIPTDVFKPLEKKPADTPPPPMSVTAMLSLVKPPMARAKVKVNEMAKQPIPVEDFQKQLGDLAAKLSFVDARQSTCAVQLAEDYAKTGQAIANSEACTAKDANECRAAFGRSFESHFGLQEISCKSFASEQARKDLVASSSTSPSEAAVQAEGNKKFEAHKATMTKVDDEFRKLVAAQQPEKLSGESTFNNIPLTRWSFGILTSFILEASASKPRVKVGNDGKFASDPMPRPLSMFVVNFSPIGYDSDARSMSAAERYRLFAGVIATPDFGLGGGVNLGIWKGVGFNVGGGVTWVPTLHDDETLSDMPKRPQDPFATAWASVLFVGASYSFK